MALKGVSAIDQAGKAFDDPAARQALYEEIRATHESTELDLTLVTHSTKDYQSPAP